MKADFSRTSFDPAQQFSAVLHQQGRVITDADLNESTAIQAHQYDSLAASLTGMEGAIWLDPNAGPPEMRKEAPRPVELRHLPGFLIVNKEAVKDVAAFADADWWISPGHYYVGGLRCENDAWVPLGAQPFLPEKEAANQVPPDFGGKSKAKWLLYLDAWERSRSWLDDPRLCDIALGAAVDTSVRAQLVWQVKGMRLPGDSIAQQLTLPWNRPQPRLRVRIKPGATSNDPCRTAFATAFQGQENQLYRVEIHDGTPPGADSPPGLKTQNPKKNTNKGDGSESYLAQPMSAKPLSFKWSRENGSVVAKVTGTKGAALLFFPGQLKAGGFRKGDRVEVVKDDEELIGTPGAMFIVDKVQGDALTCETNDEGRKITEFAVPGDKVRRWDQKPCDGTVIAVAHEWVELEHGIEVLFEPAAVKPMHNAGGGEHVPKPACLADTEFRTGDYWTFTARTATAAVDWPLECVETHRIEDFAKSATFGSVTLVRGQQGPPVPVRLNGRAPAPAADAPRAALPPHGVRHRYAVLAIAEYKDAIGWVPLDLRRILHLTIPPQ